MARSPSNRPGDLSSGKSRRAQLERIFKRYEGVCQICFDPCAREDASREHVIPLRKGGSSDDSNVILAHSDCNSLRDWIAKAIWGTIIRQAIGLSPYAERKNPGAFAPFSRLEDKPK